MPIDAPRVSIRDGQLYSDEHNDLYFSSADGLSETEYVFVQQSSFAEVVKKQDHVVVGETGFGTGLNFLATWQAWRQHASSHSQLYYISIEKYPLAAEHIRQALVQWPELQPHLEALLQRYPIRRTGYYRLSFDAGRVQLLLYFEDIQLALQQLSVSVDCWYLDGFAPKQNNDMWTADVFAEIARLSKPGTSLSTFTAAGFVRRGLEAQGFVVEKVKGFGAKREMLRADYKDQQHASPLEPWFQIKTPQTKPRCVAIIGAGLSGCSAAYECARRGMSVELFDGQGIAQAASGNPIGMCGPNLSADDRPFAQYYFAAWQYATQQFKELQGQFEEGIFRQCGITHVLLDERTRQRAQRLVAQHAQLDLWTSLHEDRLVIPQAGMVSPQKLCQAYCAQDAIEFNQCAIKHVFYHDEKWELYKEGQTQYICQADALIIANAHAATNLEMCWPLDMQLVRGQLMYVEDQQEQATIFNGDAYLTPVWNNCQVLGATFQRDDIDPDLRQTDQDELMKQCSTSLGVELAQQSLQGRVSFRSCGPDRMPLVGPLVDDRVFRNQYADIKHGKSTNQYQAPVYLPNCCVNLAHGSRGIVGSIWAAAALADYLLSGQMLLPNDLWKSTAPQRFLVRELKRT